MIRHHVEVCPDDASALAARLDTLADQGWEVMTVCWQAAGAVDDDQSAAMAATGSYVIIVRRDEDTILRARDNAAAVSQAVI